MQNPPAEESLLRESMESFLQIPLPETISELEKQVSQIENMQQQCVDTVRELMAREDVAHGIVYSKEIHELRQQKNMLETHKLYRRARIGRLRLQQGKR